MPERGEGGREREGGRRCWLCSFASLLAPFVIRPFSSSAKQRNVARRRERERKRGKQDREREGVVRAREISHLNCT